MTSIDGDPQPTSRRGLRLWALALLLLVAGVVGAGLAVVLTRDGSSSTSPSVAVERITDQQLSGENGPLYSSLHPAQQALVTRDRFIACREELLVQRPVPSSFSIRTVDTYEEPTVIPGTDGEVDSVAVTVVVSAAGDSVRATVHVVDVDGQWRWAMTEEQLADCSV